MPVVGGGKLLANGTVTPLQPAPLPPAPKPAPPLMLSPPAVSDLGPGVIPLVPGTKPAPLLPGQTDITAPPVGSTVPPVVIASSPPVPATAPAATTTTEPGTGGSGGDTGTTGREPASLDVATLGPTFTHDQLETLWLLAGGLPQYADTAAAVAQAESTGCQYAHAGPADNRPKKTCTYRKTSGEDSYGLWQINRQAHPTYTADDLYTADGNAAAAVAISKGGADFTPWTTYRTGAYLPFLQRGNAPVGGSTGKTAGSGSSLTKPPAALNTGWKNLLTVFGSGVPAAHTRMGKSGDTLTAIFGLASVNAAASATPDTVPDTGEIV